MTAVIFRNHLCHVNKRNQAKKEQKKKRLHILIFIVYKRSEQPSKYWQSCGKFLRRCKPCVACYVCTTAAKPSFDQHHSPRWWRPTFDARSIRRFELFGVMRCGCFVSRFSKVLHMYTLLYWSWRSYHCCFVLCSMPSRNKTTKKFQTVVLEVVRRWTFCAKGGELPISR